MKKVLSILLASMLALVLAACTANESAGNEENDSSNDNNDGGSEEKVLYMNNGVEPTSMNPPIGFDANSWNILNNVMEGLTRLGKDDTPQKATAESWEKSEDGTVYTFKIRDNAKWSNGDDVTAEDFEYAWKNLVDPETASPAAFLAYFIEGAEAYNKGEGSRDDVMVEAVSEKELKVTLTSPTGFFINLTANPAFFPVNKEVAENNPEWYAEADTFVGNGPFKVTEWKHDSEMMMAKNENYWDKEAVNLDKVHWAMVNDPNTEYQMYKSGDLDSSAIPSDMADQLLDSEDAVIEDQAGTYFYRFNVNKEPFQNKKIRKAFAMAINQKEIVDYVTKNKEEAAYGFVSPGFTSPSGEDFREHNGKMVEPNPEKAKQLLEEGMKEEGYDELPAVTLNYNTSESHKAIAETMQQMYKKNLGVDIELANAEWNVFLQNQKDLKHQLSRSSFLADYADPVNFLESFVTDSTMNRTGWSNEEYDKLIEKAKNETNDEKRWEYMYEAEKVLFEEMPIFPIHYYNQVVLQKPDVKDVVRHPVGFLELKWADKE
ncbi:peptide ABC transporter substrate-binding protein [Pontibacillus yanchengensis]|uniref:Peptide ABC transporter substrate-binding protein n=2 Tax=Pontibacillus yanchengensis TaxID=462910 RepID=A0ACC7VG14_9BACI|nr:peptide ABC transporter substrate-binding protein [Pontibacillus yanchengensis]MYL33878.1 peptide ABC transporter substrate-binding protein [Pontibacillus yanchengensis]MYL53903.1 peptide ABC transporter substrate-binding protein [Pontibacillus yanchengensis]